MTDVDPDTFNLTADIIRPHITNKTKAIVPVHLYRQSCDMEEIMDLAKRTSLIVIEDNAQAIGAKYTFSNGTVKSTGTIGHIEPHLFSIKNLGCFGDGGAMFTNDDKIAENLKMIANHGQQVKYYHKVTGCNSRLDSIQAAILNIKLKHLDDYSAKEIKWLKFMMIIFLKFQNYRFQKTIQFNTCISSIYFKDCT